MPEVGKEFCSSLSAAGTHSTGRKSGCTPAWLGSYIPAVTSVGYIELAHEVDSGQGTAAPRDVLGRPLLLDLLVLERWRAVGRAGSSPCQQAKLQAVRNSSELPRQHPVCQLRLGTSPCSPQGPVCSPGHSLLSAAEQAAAGTTPNETLFTHRAQSLCVWCPQNEAEQ